VMVFGVAMVFMLGVLLEFFWFLWTRVGMRQRKLRPGTKTSASPLSAQVSVSPGATPVTYLLPPKRLRARPPRFDSQVLETTFKAPFGEPYSLGVGSDSLDSQIINISYKRRSKGRT
jgi:hypothetical protein